MSFEVARALEQLILELESLLTDIRTIEDVQNSREANNEITPYVYMENTSLLKKEISSIQWVIRQLSPDQFSGIDCSSEFEDKIMDLLEQHHINANMPGAAIFLVKNKVERILETYCED